MLDCHFSYVRCGSQMRNVCGDITGGENDADVTVCRSMSLYPWRIFLRMKIAQQSYTHCIINARISSYGGILFEMKEFYMENEEMEVLLVLRGGA